GKVKAAFKKLHEKPIKVLLTQLK
ncbi:MAG: hypothetical protein JWQ06_2422, partial [Mucilaginibacter sp.]|nr:hypothetical protein [Mucilaginibacter sp.]